jgi:hypothetical protein
MGLKKKEDWVAKFNELMTSFPNLNQDEILPKATADYYYRAVALLHEAIQFPFNTTVSSITEFRINPATAFRLQYITPCLAVSAEDLKPEKKEELFTSDRWVFTSKRNGVRGWLIRMEGCLALYSRNYSSEDGRLLNYLEHLSPIIQGALNYEYNWAIDVEVEMSEDADVNVIAEMGLPTAPLELVVGMLGSLPHTCARNLTEYYNRTGKHLISLNLITPLVWSGRHFINRRLSDAYAWRQACLTALKPYLPSLYDIDMVRGSKEEKVQFLETLLSLGAEGVVAHNLDGFYSTSINRDKTVFVKLKRSVSATNLQGSSIDAWISGYELGTKGTKNENRISTLQLSIWLYDTAQGTTVEHNIARVSGLTDTIVKQISDYTNPVPVLKKELYDTVVEVDGQGISHVNWRLTHPRFIRFRDDKSKEDCQVTSDFLESCTDRVAFHTRL